MFFRGAFRYIFSGFEAYKNLAHTSTKPFNNFLFMSMFPLYLTMGVGAERLVAKSNNKLRQDRKNIR